MPLWYLTYANTHTQNICTFLHIKYVTNCTEYISSVKLIFIIY